MPCVAFSCSSHLLACLQHTLQLSESQLGQLCLLRRAYLQHCAIINGHIKSLLKRQQQILELELPVSCAGGLEPSGNYREAAEVSQQLQALRQQLPETAFLVKGIICDGVGAINKQILE